MLEVMVKNAKDNFTAFSYKESYDLLTSLYKLSGGKEKILIMIVGANGSGKTTFLANLYKYSNFRYRYVNADIILRQNQDNLKDDYDAMKYTTNLVDDLIASGNSFAYESVFSHISKLELVKHAKEAGYKIITIYLTTNDVSINIMRVHKRYLQGGHNVEENKIVSRYNRVAENVEKLLKISDEFYTIDNSNDL